MDDYKVIIYILAAVAYFLFTQWRKAFKTPEEEEKPVRPERQRQPQKPATSFEEMLRELTSTPERGEVVLESIPERVEEKIEQQKQQVIPEKKAKYKNYEDNIPKVLSWEKAAEARDVQRRLDQKREPIFKAYTHEQTETSKYSKILKNPATVRDAFVLSEIFNRKYS